MTSASALAAWQRLRTQQWAVIDGAVGEAAAARLRQEIVGLRQVRCCVSPTLWVCRPVPTSPITSVQNIKLAT